MMKIFKVWKSFLNESKDTFLNLKNQDFKNCWKVNSFLTDNHTKESDIECIGIGTDKMVFNDKNKPGYVLKIQKKNSVKENSTMEKVVWKYLKDTPFSRILAPIEPRDNFYYMLFSDKPGNFEELEKELFSISEETNFNFKELEYYFLADANSSNIRKINGKTVLIDYDDVWPWVFKNKQKIMEIEKIMKHKHIMENWRRFTIKESDYHMSHRPPSSKEGAPIYNVTLNGVYPEDVYYNGEQYYGVGDGSDSKSWKKVYSLKDKPNAFVKIYRAVPKNIYSINSGDWVTISKQYAVEHGEGMPEGYKILETKVLAKRLFTNGDSILEWGYWHDGNT